MGILSKLGITAAGEAIGQTAKPIEAIGSVLDALFTSDEERLSKIELIAKLEAAPHLAQIELTKIEATHSSVFVAGWRPAVGWVCASALAYCYILRDLIAWGLTLYDPAIPKPPPVAFEFLSTILMGMLGLGTLRTIEKVKGAADSAMTVKQKGAK